MIYMLNTALQLDWGIYNIHQDFVITKALHGSPCRANHGVCFERIYDKIKHVIMAPPCRVLWRHAACSPSRMLGRVPLICDMDEVLLTRRGPAVPIGAWVTDSCCDRLTGREVEAREPRLLRMCKLGGVQFVPMATRSSGSRAETYACTYVSDVIGKDNMLWMGQNKRDIITLHTRAK